jgi:hypothetical protein
MGLGNYHGEVWLVYVGWRVASRDNNHRDALKRILCAITKSEAVTATHLI